MEATWGLGCDSSVHVTPGRNDCNDIPPTSAAGTSPVAARAQRLRPFLLRSFPESRPRGAPSTHRGVFQTALSNAGDLSLSPRPAAVGRSGPGSPRTVDRLAPQRRQGVLGVLRGPGIFKPLAAALVSRVLGKLLPAAPRQAPAGRCQYHNSVEPVCDTEIGCNCQAVRPLRRPRPTGSNVTRCTALAAERTGRVRKTQPAETFDAAAGRGPKAEAGNGWRHNAASHGAATLL